MNVIRSQQNIPCVKPIATLNNKKHVQEFILNDHNVLPYSAIIFRKQPIPQQLLTQITMKDAANEYIHPLCTLVDRVDFSSIVVRAQKPMPQLKFETIYPLWNTFQSTCNDFKTATSVPFYLIAYVICPSRVHLSHQNFQIVPRPERQDTGNDVVVSPLAWQACAYVNEALIIKNRTRIAHLIVDYTYLEENMINWVKFSTGKKYR